MVLTYNSDSSKAMLNVLDSPVTSFSSTIPASPAVLTSSTTPISPTASSSTFGPGCYYGYTGKHKFILKLSINPYSVKYHKHNTIIISNEIIKEIELAK